MYFKTKEIGIFELAVRYERGVGPRFRLCLLPAGVARFWISVWIFRVWIDFRVRFIYWGNIIG